MTAGPASGTIPDGKIPDYIDGKYRNDTPEEYVRQTIEKRLVNEHKYSPKQIQVEFPLQVGSRKPRADLVLWEKDAPEQTQDTVFMVIECKRESIGASSVKDGVQQLKRYMNACPNCRWGMWTNSLQKFVFQRSRDRAGKTVFTEYNDIPSANGSLEDVNRPTWNSLKVAHDDDNLLFVFRTCHNHIYVNDGLQKQSAFFELLKVIFCKIEDERRFPVPLQFYTTSAERSNPDGQLTVYKRISAIFQGVKRRFQNIFDPGEEIRLSPRSLAYIVSELQPYSLLNTDIDYKGKAYEEIVGSNLRGDRGEFFTPRNVMKMVVSMVNPQMDERVLDSSCGTGGFVVAAMTYVMEQLKEQLAQGFGVPYEAWSADQIRFYRERVSAMTARCYFGFDLNPDLVKATKMNMVMNNDGSGNILQTNSLLPPHEWSEDFRTGLAAALGIPPAQLRNHKTLAFFDVIVTNPPFGSRIPIKDEHILQQYNLAHIWECDRAGGVWRMTDRLQSSVPPEILFIERCTQFLVPGGRMGIVLPDSILGSPSLGYIREWLIRHHRIVASVDLHADTFQPHNGTQTSVLILQKKSEEQMLREELRGAPEDYSIFMAMVERIGHDKRGNPVFKRDAEGSEILVEDTGRNLAPAGAEEAALLRRKVKVKDDQTLEVPPLFARWKRQEGIGW